MSGFMFRKRVYVVTKLISMYVKDGKKSNKTSPSAKSEENLDKNSKGFLVYCDIHESSSTGSSESGSSAQISIIEKGENDTNSIKSLKQKPQSKSLRKKFFRLFPNVEEDEEVFDWYSCALLSDLLLHGVLYVTTHYLGFYSNVFGYVTKLLIPIVSIEDITKEKTAKIFPNAIGIVTAEQKHVFGSFLSRDSTLEFIKTVWEKAKSEAELLENELLAQELDYSELEDEIDHAGTAEADNTRSNVARRTSKFIAQVPKTQIHRYFKKITKSRVILLTTTVLLLIILYISAALLLYRISRMQDKYSVVLQDIHRSDSGGIYRDILEWQAKLQSESDGAVYSFLDSNLDKIAKVKESLEALSSLLLDTVDSQQENNLSEQERGKS